jgi:hypothetical protein
MDGGGPETTGTSAVNADGEILVFCDIPACDLETFTISGREIALFGGDEDESPAYRAVFGPLTVAAAKLRGTLVAVFVRYPGRQQRLFARHGL